MRKNEISDDSEEDFEDSVSKQEKNIFKYQFVLNYMSKPNIKEKFQYILRLFELNSSWEDVIKKMLIPCLESKLKKVTSASQRKKCTQAEARAKYKLLEKPQEPQKMTFETKNMEHREEA